MTAQATQPSPSRLTVEYPSQRVAYPYFVLAVLLFALQVVFGLLLILKYIWPDPLVHVLPFNIARAVHTNLLVLWMILAFMGATYYITPTEAQRDIFSPKLAMAQFWLLALTGVGFIVGLIFGRWSLWAHQGWPLLEIPTWGDFLIVIGALMFLFNIGATIFTGKRKTVTSGMLLGGLTMLAIMYLFGMPNYRNLTIHYYYWWWVVHLWVEGAWELIAASMMAFLLMHLTGVDRRVVEKWIYLEVGLVLFTGIAGIGHHYYWIGTQDAWLWVGGIFSALQPLPIVLMVVDALASVRRRSYVTPNRIGLYWAVGCAFFHLLGAGAFGIVHTLPQVNKWTHGSQVTVSHGHLAFFGAYAMLNITMFYVALPYLRSGILPFSQRRSFRAIWLMVIAMVTMGLAWGVAGVLQSYLERMMGLPYRKSVV